MTFARLLSEAIASDGLPRTGDVLAVCLPLLREIEELHEQGLVAGLRSPLDVHYDGTAVHLVDRTGSAPLNNADAIRSRNPATTASGIEVRDRHQVDMVVGSRAEWKSGDVHESPEPAPRPMLLVGYRAWEQDHAHHDALTDTLVAGLLITSFACGLDLDNERDVHTLAGGRRQLTSLNPGLHPVVANVLTEMIDPDRHDRPPEISQIITRLEHHRELPDELDLSAAYADPADWRRGVLETLRERVFDTTRRNRALYFRPSASTVSLTEASVPLLLDVARVAPDDLFTWTSGVADKLRSGSTVDLEQWCRFEDSPHVAPALDKLISNERKLRNEQGHGRLRLIVAFLRWFDLQNDEVVHSPLLLMPVELKRRKGVKKRYQLSVEGDALVNPILRFVFKDRFDITMPETIDSTVESITAFVSDLEGQVRATAPEVGIEVIEKPRIDLLRRRAQLRVDTYRRNRARTQAQSGRWRRVNHSYSSDDWRPLGLALYQRFVASSELPLRNLAGAAPRPRSSQMFTDTDTASTGPGVGRTGQTYSTAQAEVHQNRWEVDLCSVTLAMLGSRRTSLSRDYDDLLTELASGSQFAGTPFSELFAPDVLSAQPEAVAPITVDQQLVLPADDAQARAVRRAVRGDSFIIQGPPGTGKSQTITNVIAALVADGKRVLFVCEKRAALDVVGHRLRQVGLGDLVATIHDSQLDRKAFVMDLGATYSGWIESGTTATGGATLSPRAQALADIATRLKPLDFLVQDLSRPRLGALSVSGLIEQSVLMRSQGIEPAAEPDYDVSLENWFSSRSSLDAVHSALVSAGLDPSIGNHAALRVQPSFAAQADPISAVISLGRELQQAIQDLRVANATSDGVDSIAVSDLQAAQQFGSTVAAAANGAGTASLDASAPQHSDLRRDAESYTEAELSLTQSTTPSRWKQMLSAEDARNGIAIAEANEGSFFKFLNGGWRNLKKTVDESYDFSQHSVAPPYSAVLAELVEHHDRAGALETLTSHSLQRYGVADPRIVRDLVDQYHNNALFADLVRSPAVGPGAKDEIDAAAHAATALSALADQLVLNPACTIAELDSLASALLATSVAQEQAVIAWGHTAASGTQIPPDVLRWVSEAPEHIRALELCLIDAAATTLLAETDTAMRGGAEIDGLVATLLDQYRDLLDANAEDIRTKVRTRFLDHVAHSEASMAGRSDQDKAFKRSYNAGRRVLEREFAKKMRYRSIRDLADGDTGLVVRDLRPIWLMSPLSVSDTLPMDASMFDAVIFDEASQIPVEDAIPSTFRSNQVIVVGDRMQLPPTRFFSAAGDGDDDVIVTEDDQSVTISLDADSFLTQADQALSSTMLTWHYRSRSESLIAYSNAAFYEGALATVPDLVHESESRPEIRVENIEDAAKTVDDLLTRPISFHRLLNGVYRSRANQEEADYIAEMVRALLMPAAGSDQTDATIGVVAFSEAQQSAIESSLTELATLDDAFAVRLEAERNRTEDGEYLGLFVKNLENVQGDERDIIILSVCYAPGEDGRMRMNFGPINQAGGERRLNVIFSRAKRHMAVVSSIEGHQITNTHNDGAAHLASFLQYAASESTGDQSRSTAILQTQLGDRQATPDHARSAIAEGIAAALRSAGHHVDVSVGRSEFTIDVAVRNDDRYVLGLLIDPPDGEPVASRFVAEASVLDAFDWPILRVTPAEWWTSPDRVIERVNLRLDR